MPSWKDNLTGPEIDALHKYKTQGKESLSGDEIDIVHKYRTYLNPQDATKSKALLGLEAIEPSAPVQKDKEPSIIEKGLSAGAAVGGLLASPLHGLGNIAGAIGELTGQGKAEDIAASINQYMPGSQQSPLTQKYSEKIGKALDPLNAVMPNLQMMHGLTRPAIIKVPRVPEVKSTLADRVAKAEQEVAPVKPEVPSERIIVDEKGVAVPESMANDPGLQLAKQRQLEFEQAYNAPQGEVIGGQYGGRKAMPWDTPQETLTPKLPIEERLVTPEEVVPDTQRLATRHDIPTVEFPLRQEVLEQPEIKQATEAFRAEAERLQTVVDNAINPKNREKAATELKALQEEFGAGMRQLGIDIPQEAIGLQKLYQGGEGTKLPVQQTFNAGKFNKKQGGAVNFGFSEAVVDGINKLSKLLTPEELAKVVRSIRSSKIEEELTASRTKLNELKSSEPKSSSPFVTKARERSIERTQEVINTLEGIQAGFGKSQRGSIGFPQKKAPTLEQYKKNIEQELEREVSNEVANKLYLEDYPHLSQTNKTKTVISKVPGLEEFNKYESRPVLDDPTGIKSVERMERVGDQDITVKMGSTGKSVLSAGRLQGWRSKSPVAYEGIGFITSVKDTYRIKTAEYLSSFNKASQVFDLELFGASQWRKGAQVFDVRRGNERNPKLNPREILNEQQMELFDTMDKTLSTIGKEVKTRLEEVGAKVDFEQLPFYFTSLFTGDYAIPVFNRQTGQFMFNLREITKTNAFKAKEWLESHPDYKPGEVNISDVSPSVNRQLSEARMMSNFEQMLDLLGRNDPATMEALNVLSGRQTGAGMHTSAMPNRFKEKSGRFGSLGDKPWLSERQNYLDNKKVFEMYVSGANEWLANTQISEFLKNMNSSEKITATNAKSLVNDYGNYVLGLKDSGSAWYKDAMTVVEHSLGRSRGDVAKAARIYSQAVTAQLVGWWSPRAMIQNVFQPAQAAIPMIQKLKYVEGYQGDILASIAKGTHEGILDILDHWKDSDYISATRGFKQDNHVIDAHLVDQIRTVGGSHRAGAIYNTLANRSVSYAEQFARSVTFSIVHNFLESSGVPKERALDMAKNITHEIMVNYEEYAKPQVFGRTGLPGELAGKLQTYKINDLTQTIGYFEDIAKSNPKTWVPISTKLMMSIMFAGLTGIIGMDIAALMWETAQQANSRTEEPNEYLATHTLKDFIYESSPVAVSKGALTALTGYDLSGAFAQNLVGEDPTKSIIPILGKTGEQLAAPINLMSGSDVGVAKGITAFTPSSLSHLPEKHLLTEDRGDEKVVYSPNTGEVTYKGPDQGLLSNLRTNERSRQSAERTSLFKARENISEAKKSAEKSTLNFVVDWATAKTQQDADKAVEKISNNLLKYHNAGGDIETLWGSIEEKLVRVGIADDVLNTLKQDVTMSNRIIFQRALELNELRK